jgi:hypothetical protein
MRRWCCPVFFLVNGQMTFPDTENEERPRNPLPRSSNRKLAPQDQEDKPDPADPRDLKDSKDRRE